MSMSTIADWCTILFLLWFGLKTFIPALEKGFFSTLGEFSLWPLPLPQSSTAAPKGSQQQISPPSMR